MEGSGERTKQPTVKASKLGEGNVERWGPQDDGEFWWGAKKVAHARSWIVDGADAGVLKRQYRTGSHLTSGSARVKLDTGEGERGMGGAGGRNGTTDKSPQEPS